MPVSRSAQIDRHIAQALSDRRSVRRYLPDQPSRALIEQLLQLATTAPSAHNRQPWRIVVIQAYDTKARLARRMGDKLQRDRMKDGDDLNAIESDVARSFARITSAPVIILMCLTMEDMDRYSDDGRNDYEYCLAIQSTAMAGQNLMLAAHIAGLSSCWMCAPMFCPELVQDELNLAPHWIPQGMITLGYPLNQGKPFSRKSLSDVTLFIDGSGHDESQLSNLSLHC